MLPYTSYEEFNQRVGESVIIFDGQPIWVAKVTPRCELLYADIPNTGAERYKTCSGYDPRLNAHDIKLGYINDIGAGAVYAQRIPVRRGTQGLNSGNVAVQGGHQFLRLLEYQSLSDMLLGVYPSYDAVKRIITEKNAAYIKKAFNRRWSLFYDKEFEIFGLEYRGNKVAKSLDSETFKLPNTFNYLKETLRDLNIKVA